MCILFVVLCAISFWGIKTSPFHEDYLNKTSTEAIKGFFAIIILYSHMRNYLHLSDSFCDRCYENIISYFGQLMVVMYFFYSGYGLMESIKKKPKYLNTFFKNRIIKILIHFDIAVLLFIILQSILGNYFPFSVYMLSIIGWESVGNSNWFIFDILLLYVLFLFSSKFSGCVKMRMLSKSEVFLLIMCFVCFVMWLALYFVKGQMWWIDTLFTFPLGMAFSIYKAEIDSKLQNKLFYYSSSVIVLLFFIVWHFFRGVDPYGVCSCVFALGIVLISMKIKIGNPLLTWLGKRAFSLYILQRIPMILLSHLGINQNKVLFVSFTIVLVLIFATVYDSFLQRLDAKYFGRKI